MAIRLEKGQRINLEKNNGQSLRQFCVGCNWGAIITKTSGFLGFGSKTRAQDVDLDLSCLVLDGSGQILDYLYSPDYRPEFLADYGLPPGHLDTADKALHHSGDDRKGDQGGDDGLDNEVITVDLDKIDNRAQQIIFFLNNVGAEDFAAIPYAAIRMYEGTPTRAGEVFASYDVAAEARFQGCRALLMGRLYRRDGKWRFAALGDATTDDNIAETIQRILRDNASRG